MDHIKIMRGNIFSLKKPTDVIIVRDKKTPDIIFDKSVYDNSNYIIKIPDKALNDENVVDYLEYYKMAIKKAKNKGMKTMAIEAIDLGDEDLNFALATEFAIVIKEAIGLTIGIASLLVTIICKDRDMSDIYELAIFGEIRSSQVTMSDRLEYNNAILIPTTKKTMKFERSYKEIKKREPASIFFKCYMNPRLLPGKYFLATGSEVADYYYFVPLVHDKKMKQGEFSNSVIDGVLNVLKSAPIISWKNITIPIVRFTKKEEENKRLVKRLVDAVCDYIDDQEINVKFYCPYEELWDVVVGCFEKEDSNEVRLI